MKRNYDFFNKIIYRSPEYTINSFFEIPNNFTDISSFVKTLFQTDSFREAIYLASPSLFKEWEKCYNGNNNDEKKRNLEYNIIKYFIRSIFNCTPFGTFSSYSLITNTSHLEETKKLPYLNYSYVKKIFDEIGNELDLKHIINYSVNNSLYKVGNTYRYMEYNQEKDQYQLSSINSNPIIDFLLRDRETKSIDEFCDLITNRFDGINRDQTNEFILTLIDAQILLIDVRPCINGKDFISQLEIYKKQYPVLQQYLFKYSHFLSNEIIYNFTNTFRIDKWNKLAYNDNELSYSIINVNL